MARKAKSSESTGSSKKIRPALTPEARELQMISLAVDLAEKQLLEGTASSQVITHYLKLGSSREARKRATGGREQSVAGKSESNRLHRRNQGSL